MSSQGSINSSIANNASNFSDHANQGFPPNLDAMLTSSSDLPALNEGEYSTDEYRMYCFKVHPCNRTYAHVWSQCPYFHPGENARRRDPRIYKYSPLQCDIFRITGTCPRGDACCFSHGLFETWLHPGQYRTRVCRDRGNCTRPICFFAHNQYELRPLYSKTGSAERDLLTPLPPLLPQPVMSSPIDDQLHQLSNLRMLQNIRLGQYNSGLNSLEDIIPRPLRPEATSFTPLLPRSPESDVTSDSHFLGGPFFGYGTFH